VESSNKQILNGLKKRLDAAKGLWADELSTILWSIHTTEKSATGETPFMLVYGSEVVLPIEVPIHTHRVAAFQKTLNSQALQDALDLLPLVRGNTYLCEEVAKACLTRFYNRRWSRNVLWLLES